MLWEDESTDCTLETEEQVDVFKAFKARMAALSILAVPKIGRPYMMDCYANAYVSMLHCLIKAQ